MKTMFCGLMLVLAVVLVAVCCPQLADAAVCNCGGVPGACVCPAGDCQCPNCPNSSMFRRSNPNGGLSLFLSRPLTTGVPIVVQAPAAPATVTFFAPTPYDPRAYTTTVTTTYSQPVVTYSQPSVYYTPTVQTGTGCYQDAFGRWVCPQQAQQSQTYIYRPPGMSGGDWRRVKRAVRNGDYDYSY